MDTRVATQAVQVIRAERDRAIAELNAENPEYADQEWLLSGEPFFSDLCLTILVAIRHEIERELLQLAARATADGKELSRTEYETRVRDERKKLKDRGGWKSLIATLHLEAVDEWKSMETLRFLANSYKHNPATGPDDDLLGHLGLSPKLLYAPLAESEAIREALALSLGFGGDSNFCDIADNLVSRARRFLEAAAKAQPQLSHVKPGRVSFKPSDWAR